MLFTLIIFSYPHAEVEHSSRSVHTSSPVMKTQHLGFHAVHVQANLDVQHSFFLSTLSGASKTKMSSFHKKTQMPCWALSVCNRAIGTDAMLEDVSVWQ